MQPLLNMFSKTLQNLIDPKPLNNCLRLEEMSTVTAKQQRLCSHNTPFLYFSDRRQKAVYWNDFKEVQWEWHKAHVFSIRPNWGEPHTARPLTDWAVVRTQVHVHHHYRHPKQITHTWWDAIHTNTGMDAVLWMFWPVAHTRMNLALAASSFSPQGINSTLINMLYIFTSHYAHSHLSYFKQCFA